MINSYFSEKQKKVQATSEEIVTKVNDLLELKEKSCKLVLGSPKQVTIGLPKDLKEIEVMACATFFNQVIMGKSDGFNQRITLMGHPDEILKALTKLKSINTHPPKNFFRLKRPQT